MKYIPLAITLLAAPAAAQDRASVLIGSHHVGAVVPFREFNPGLFLTWDLEPVDLTIGAYRNSFGKPSVAAFASLPLIEWDGGAVEALAGITLYPEDGRLFAIHVGDVVPLVGLNVRHGNAFAQIMPGDGKHADAVIAFGITFHIED